MDVKIKDRKTEVEYLRFALNLTELGVDYITTDLINTVFEAVKKKKGKFNIEDACKIRVAHDEKWSAYFTSLRKKEIEVTAKKETE